MGDLKINRNRPKLTPEEEAKGKDFNSVLSGYAGTQIPFYKTTKFYLSVVVTGGLIAVGSMLLTDDKDPLAEVKRPFIDPIMQHVNDTTYKVDAASGGRLEYFNGSYIEIPEGAFLDKNGQPVKGNVEIRYREFHDPADIILAGIPMTYDSAGVRRHFESAGMFELTAWNGNEPLQVNPAQPVKVHMVTHTDEPKFNVYYLDTAKKNWEYLKADKAVLLGVTQDSSVAPIDPNALAALLTEPIKPGKANTKHPLFNIAVDPVEFPELALYKGILFEVDEKKTPYDPELKKVAWEDAEIQKNKNDNSYLITFRKDNESHSFVTRVVVSENNYAAAMKQYNDRHAAYEDALKLRKLNDKGKTEKLEKEMKRMDSERIARNLQALQQAMANRTSYGSPSEDMLFRVFIVEKFGIWNSDYPCALPNGMELAVVLKNGATGNELKAAHIYLVEKSRNAIFTYYDRDLAKFRYNPAAENLLWCVTGDNKIAILKPDEFDRIDTTKKQVVLKLEVTDKQFTNTAEAKAFLNI